MPFQMALDEVLFRQAIRSASPKEGVPCLRFYFSSGPWVTVGYSQKKNNSANGLPSCRRLTGGGTVFHGQDLVFSLIAGKRHDPSFHGVPSSYIKIHEAVQCGLEKLGKKTRFFRCTENLPKGDECFRFPIASDLAVNGRKVAGGAQKRSCGTFLHQESLRTEGIDARDLMEAIRDGFRAVFRMEWAAADWAAEFLFQAEELARKKYSSEEWTLGAGGGSFRQVPLNEPAAVCGGVS